MESNKPLLIKEQYTGVMTPNTKKFLDEMTKYMDTDDKVSCTVNNIALRRQEIDKFVQDMIIGDPRWKQYEELCDIENIVIPGGDGQDMKVMVIKSKANQTKQGLVGHVSCPWGGVFDTLLTEKNVKCRMATVTDMVVFSVDYRIAPETRSPNNMKDVVAAVKYLHENAETFGVNKDQIMLNGGYWGATMALGAAILLGRENKQHLVKALFLQMGWLNDCLKGVEPNTV